MILLNHMPTMYSIKTKLVSGRCVFTGKVLQNAVPFTELERRSLQQRE